MTVTTDWDPGLDLLADVRTGPGVAVGVAALVARLGFLDAFPENPFGDPLGRPWSPAALAMATMARALAEDQQLATGALALVQTPITRVDGDALGLVPRPDPGGVPLGHQPVDLSQTCTIDCGQLHPLELAEL